MTTVGDTIGARVDGDRTWLRRSISTLSRILKDAWERHEVAAPPGEITVISDVEMDDSPIGGVGDGESVCHADLTCNPTRPRAALLHAQDVPAPRLLNLHAAYEALPVDRKQAVVNLECIHDASLNSAGEPRPGFARDAFDPQARRLMHRTPVSDRAA